MSWQLSADPTHMAGENLLADAVALASPEDAYEQLVTLDWPADREACWVLYLDVKHRLIDAELASLGALSNTFMVPRELYRNALTRPRCGAIILAHNHPSGDADPSGDDELITRRLTSAGELIGIDLLDHIIVTRPDNDRWVSLARRGHV